MLRAEPLLLLSTLGALATCGGPSAAHSQAGVAVGDNGAQALAKDNTTYMGQVLEMDRDDLAWAPSQGASHLPK